MQKELLSKAELELDNLFAKRGHIIAQLQEVQRELENNEKETIALEDEIKYVTKHASFISKILIILGLGKIGKQIKGKKKSIEELVARHGEIKQRCNQLERNVEEINVKITEQSNHVSALKEIVEEFEQKIYRGKNSLKEKYGNNLADNEFYLNHLIDKSPNTIGSVFLDYRNKVSDRKIIVYGHNSQNIYTDFRVLENYLDWNYYLNHSDIYFRTMDKRNHYLIFSVYIATSDYRYINLEFTNDQYGYHLQYLKDKSIYETGINVDGDDEIIVLQTCYYNPMGSYLIIVGKKV